VQEEHQRLGLAQVDQRLELRKGKKQQGGDYEITRIKE
jgi:hypothetical protein